MRGLCLQTCARTHPRTLPHCSYAEEDLRPIFEPFGPLDFVLLQKDVNGAYTGIGFVQ